MPLDKPSVQVVLVCGMSQSFLSVAQTAIGFESKGS